MANASVEIGKKAPAVSLSDQNDKARSLDEFRGQWVVVYFYPKDDTPGCTKEACEFTGGLKTFEDLNAVIIGVSPDSPASHRKFIEKYGLKITLLSDPDHKVMEIYGAWGPKAASGEESVSVIRSTVVVDPDGKIAYHWPNVKAEGHAEEVRKVLEQLQAKA